MSPNLKGIIATLCASLCFVTSDTLVKLTAPHLPLGEILAIRGAILVTGLAVLIMMNGEWRHLVRLGDRLVVQRSLLEALIAYFFISALGVLPLANLTAIFLTAPLMMTAVSATLLRESVGWRRWSAVAAGFVGMLLVVKPSIQGFSLASLFGLAAAALSVARDLTTRRINPATPSLIVTLGASLSVALLGLSLGLVEKWIAPPSADLARLFATALALGGGSFSIIIAYRSAEASVISPFRYGVIILALLSGYLVWGERPDGPAFTGIAIILGANLYIVHRERLRARSTAGKPSDHPSADNCHRDKR